MLPERQSPLAANQRASNVNNGDTTTVQQAADHLTHMQRRVLVDSLLDAWSVYWERRARALEAARPLPGDFHGSASREELSAQWHRLTEIAKACRARAHVSPLDLVVEDVDAVLGEVA